MNIDTPLLQLSPVDHFTLRDAFQGVSILGGIGSGKTSGSGRYLAGAYLRAGMGGLILCAKPEEAELWRQYVHAHGRAESLFEFDGRHGGFNFLAYELARQGVDGLNAVVECLLRVVEAARNASPSPGRSGDAFWEDTTRQLLRNTIPVVYAATGSVSIPDIIAFVRSAPRTPEEMQDRAWQAGSFMCHAFVHAERNLGADEASRFASYWRNEFATLDPKTRGNIAISLTTSLDRFNHGWLKTAFCGDTTIVPEVSLNGGIILLNMPALTLNEDGVIAQQIFKYMWQRAMLARNALAPPFRERPVFLWADEAQYFVNSYDAEFMSTCRGSRVCTVFLSQSLPTYYAKIGGDNVQHRVHHLLGNFATKVFHSSACPETNEWGARMIGRRLQNRRSYTESEGTSSSGGMSRGENTSRGRSSSYGGSSGGGAGGSHSSSSSSSGSTYSSGDNWSENRGHGENRGSSRGYSEQMDYDVEPALFSKMPMTGGPANGNLVSAIWYQAGRRFQSSHGNYLLAIFRQ